MTTMLHTVLFWAAYFSNSRLFGTFYLRSESNNFFEIFITRKQNRCGRHDFTARCLVAHVEATRAFELVELSN